MRKHSTCDTVSDDDNCNVQRYIVACSYFAAVHLKNETSLHTPDNDPSQWGDLSTLPFIINYPKTAFKAEKVAVRYAFLTERFVCVF